MQPSFFTPLNPAVGVTEGTGLGESEWFQEHGKGFIIFHQICYLQLFQIVLFHVLFILCNRSLVFILISLPQLCNHAMQWSVWHFEFSLIYQEF